MAGCDLEHCRVLCSAGILHYAFMRFFKRYFRQEEKKDEQWPSVSNPCSDPEHQKKSKAPLWDVQGHVTTLCVFCVLEREKQHGGDREKALATFLPDPAGNPVQK